MIKIIEIEPGFEFRFRIIDTSTGYEEKAYSFDGAKRAQLRMHAKNPSAAIA